MLPLFARSDDDPTDLLLAQDVIYVGGGNTANMLAIWRLHGVDTAMREAYERGILLCGTSAGANCWFDACSTDSFGPGLQALRDGLGLLPGGFCPHFDGEELRRPLRQMVDDGDMPTTIAADDGVAVIFEDGALSDIVAERPDASAYRLEPGLETELPLGFCNARRCTSVTAFDGGQTPNGPRCRVVTPALRAGQRADAGDVRVDGGDQLVDRAVPLLVAQAMGQLQADRRAVHVGVEVQQVGLDPHLLAAVGEGRVSRSRR